MSANEQKYHEGAVTIPEFATFVADHPTGFCEQKLITCGYFLEPVPGEAKVNGIYAYCGSTGNYRGESGSQGELGSTGEEGPSGISGIRGDNPEGWSKKIFVLKLKYQNIANAQFNEFQQDRLNKLAEKLDISPPGKRVIMQKYKPLTITRDTKTVYQTLGLYKKSLFDEYAAVLRKMNPTMDDVSVAYYRSSDDEDDFNDDFAELRPYDTEEGCIEKSRTQSTQTIQLDTWTVNLQLFYVDLIKPVNVSILREICQIVEACSS